MHLPFFREKPHLFLRQTAAKKFFSGKLQQEASPGTPSGVVHLTFVLYNCILIDLRTLFTDVDSMDRLDPRSCLFWQDTQKSKNKSQNTSRYTPRSFIGESGPRTLEALPGFGRASSPSFGPRSFVAFVMRQPTPFGPLSLKHGTSH